MKPLHNNADKYELYQLADRDVNFLVNGDYHPSEILVFNRGTSRPQPGQEIARADTLTAARTYINELSSKGESLPLDDTAALYQPKPPTAKAKDRPHQELESKYTALLEENKKLEQKQRETQERVRQLSLDTLTADQSKKSLLEDLANISTSQSELINELDELRVEVHNLRHENLQLLSDNAEITSQRDSLQNSYDHLKAKQESATRIIDKTDKETKLRTADGGTVRIYHQFPVPPKRSLFRRFATHISNTWLRYVLIMLVGLYVFWSMSLFLTLESNGVDISTYSDTIWSEFTNPLRTLFGS